MASDSEPIEKIRDPPRPLQKSHFGGAKCFSTAISVQKTLANCHKASIKSHQLITETVVTVLNRPTPDFVQQSGDG